MKFLTSSHPASSVCFSFIELFFLFIGFEKLRKSQGEKALEVTKPVFLPLHPPLSGHVPRKRRFTPIRQLLNVLHTFPVISYFFINILSYKNLYPISLRILYLHIIFVFDIFTTQIHFYIIPKNPQMCPAHRDLPTPSHPHSRLNLSFPAPSHTDTSQQNSRPPQPSTPKKSPRGVQRGRGFAAPLRFSFFPQKKYCAPFAKKANATQYFKKSISKILLLYLTTRTLYMPSISLSSSSALAEAALSRSIRV